MPEILQNALLAFFFFLKLSQCHSTSRPLNCSETARICTSFLAFKAAPNVTISLVQSMFDVFPEDVTADKSSSPGYLFIRKNCSCLYNKKYLANTTFTMRGREGLVNETVASAYDGLALLPNSTRRARVGAVISLHLICGCSSGLWNYLMSYVMEDGDSVQSLSSRFGVSMDDIETVNGMDGPNGGFVGDVYYIPLNSVPGQPYLGDISPTTQPAPAPTSSTVSEYQDEHSTKFPYLWVIGSAGVTVFMIGTAVLLCVSFRSCNFQSPYSHRKCPEQPIPHKFQILNSSSFCYASRRFLCFKSENFKHSTQDSGDHLVNIPNERRTDGASRVLMSDFAMGEVERRKIIIYTDLGIDDAMAIFITLRSQEIEVIGLTTTQENVYTTLATKNALHLLEIAGRSDMPVTESSHTTIKKVTKLRITAFVYGSDGLGNQNFPPPQGKATDQSAAEFLVERANQSPGKVTVVALGTLTNIAMAIELDPKFPQKVGQIVILGGAFAINGNVNPAAEANIFGDPDAADINFTSGADILAVGINITHQVILTDADRDKLSHSEGKFAQCMCKILDF